MSRASHEWPRDSAAIQLVTFEQGSRGSPGTSRLVVKDEARRELLRVAGSRPVRAVAVCGLYRTGKSLLLNLLSGTQGSDRKSRFAVGDSVRACTAGVWVRASTPAPDGSVCLLLDCEGSGSTDRDREHDSRLFALAVLISSLLIFNTRGVIGDSSVQALAVAASLAQHIFRQHEDLVDGQRLAPAFLWVLRDFALALEDLSGNSITAQEYMENILTPGGTGAAGEEAPPGVEGGAAWQGHREARATVKELFPERDCATLCIPVEDEEQLQVLGQLTLDEMRPKFARQVGELRAKVLHGCPILRAPGGETATGGAWIALLESHVHAMNSGSVPKLGSTWQHVSEQECARALDEAMRAFSATTLGLAASFPTSVEDLEEALQRGQASAREKFTEIALGDSRARKDFEADLARELKESADRLRKENRDIALRANEAWLRQRLEQDFEDKFRLYQQRFDTGTLTPDACKEAESVLGGKLRVLRTAYMQEAVGPEEAIVEAVERILIQRQDALRRELAAWSRAASRKDRRGSGRAADPSDVLLREKGGRGGGRPEPDDGEIRRPKCCAVQ